MNFPIYWLMQDIQGTDYLSYGEGMSFETIVCYGNPDHAARQIRSSPLRVKLGASILTDFLWTAYGEPLVNLKVMNAFRREGIEGCIFKDSIIENTMGEDIAVDFYEMKCTGWGGMAAPASNVRVLEECPYCKRRVFSGYSDPSLLFDIDAWNGSEFFIIWPLPQYIFLTETAKRFITLNKFTGVKAVPITKLPKAIAGTLTPGAVTDWFDDRVSDIIINDINRCIGKIID